MVCACRDLDIAIIGYSARFPGANTIDQFWSNLCDGVESISAFSEAELSEAGISRESIRNPAYVKARGIIGDVAFFDASFFNFTPREAEITDPQHRIFLECAYEALENAAYAPGLFRGTIGVFGGVSENTYLKYLESCAEQIKLFGPAQMAIANRKDHLCPRVSYKLNLRGPSMLIQTACSTSLVAVHVACRSLLAGECDLALAGAASVVVPEICGYSCDSGTISSPDGRCRPFDEKAAGTVPGNGVALVVLRRLAEAIEDGDFIHAVVKGSSVNNDGSSKVGYTAPGIDGQAANITRAQVAAEIDPRQISYVEAFGTGTNLGDPIEVAALTKSFQRDSSGKTRCCPIGSVKGNVGHLDTAAGMAGLLKTVLALEHKLIPPTLHFEKANPRIAFADSPFYVNDRLSSWQSTGDFPRTAGVNAYGIGGTNAHVIVQEAPQLRASEEAEEWQLLVLSAKTENALRHICRNLAVYLEKHRELNMADVAYTLAHGRDRWPCRAAIVCRGLEDAILLLRSDKAGGQVLTGIAFESQSGPEIARLNPAPGQQRLARREIIQELGALWIAGLEPDWAKLYVKSKRRRIPLPSYPFERQQYWISRDGQDLRKSANQQQRLYSQPPATQKLYPRPALSVPYLPCEDTIQSKTAEIWQQFLGFDPIGIHDNFFELGGDSLLAIQTAARIREVFMVDFQIGDFFSGPTVARIASIVQAYSGNPDRCPSIIEPGSFQEPLPLSFEEELYWWIAQSDARYLGCNVAGAFRLTGKIEDVALRQALEWLERRHEILRTAFVATPDRPKRVIYPTTALDFSTIDLQQMAPEMRDSEAQRIAQVESTAPFDLTRAPLFRVKLLHLNEQEHILIVVFHHITADGWSLKVFLNEFGDAYQDYCSRVNPALPDLPFQYGDYAAWQQSFFTGSRLATLEGYWSKQLAGICALPFRQKHTAEAFPQDPKYTFVINKELTQAARCLSRAWAVTLFSTLLAVFKVWLYQQTGSLDISVAVPVAKRPEKEMERMLGLFATTLILRTDLAGQPRFIDLLRRVHRVAQEAYVHQDMPLKKLLHSLGLRPAQGNQQFSHVVFNFLREPWASGKFADLTIREFPLNSSYSNSEQLHLSIRDDGDALLFAVTYKSTSFTEKDMREFGEEYCRLLDYGVTSPETQIQDLVTAPAEMRRS